MKFVKLRIEHMEEAIWKILKGTVQPKMKWKSSKQKVNNEVKKNVMVISVFLLKASTLPSPPLLFQVLTVNYKAELQ